MKKNINKLLPYIIVAIFILISFISIIYADYLFESNNVSFNNSNTTLSSSDVQGAIDELYNKCNNIPVTGSCPEGHVCSNLVNILYNANGGTFSDGHETKTASYYIFNDVMYELNDKYEEPVKSGYYLASWNTSSDGSGTTYKYESDIVSLVNNNTNMTLYAQYSTVPTCQRATTLHTETCNHPSSTLGAYCREIYANNSVITYGRYGTNNSTLTSGDAFDCDINGDGVYNASTERFYYVSDLYKSGSYTNGEYDNTYATLIYYNGIANGTPSNSTATAWYSDSISTSNGPATAKLQLPTTTQWNNVRLKNISRNIYTETGTISKSNFSYSGYAARLLTLAEIYAGCYDGSHNITSYMGALDNRCQYLLENTDYSNPSSVLSGWWLETSSSTGLESASTLAGYNRRATISMQVNGNSGYGARPAIEVPKSRIDLEVKVYQITFDGNGGSSISKGIVKGSSLGTLPTSTRSGYTFLGWFTSSSGGTEVTSSTIPSQNTTYYAHWEQPPICKQATSGTLHWERCLPSGQKYQYCRVSYSSNAVITYGQIGTSGQLNSGDAFDCDINNDGTYDASTERFYYVSDYYNTSTQSFDNTYATLIYYSSTSSGEISTSTSAWASTSFTTNGPITAIAQLPTTSQWRSDLLKTTTRNILQRDSNGTITITKSNFSYSGYAARLLTYQEVYASCSKNIANCQYLMERTTYANSGYGYGGYGPWLETTYSNQAPWVIYTLGGSINNEYGASGANIGSTRPAIEVPKSRIQY